MARICEKASEIFADSEFVVTFAPAIGKSSLSSEVTGLQFYNSDLATSGIGIQDCKSSWKIVWWIRKKVLPLRHFPSIFDAKKFLKSFGKVLGKLFGGFEKRFYLCTTFRSENGQKVSKKMVL